MSAHTPGPWSICFDSGRQYERCLIGGNEPNYVAKLVRSPGDPRMQADGHLIAAAPEMLHALEMVRDANRDDPHIPSIALATIEAAIAKATGGDQ